MAIERVLLNVADGPRLSELLKLFEPFGFLRIHHSYAVSLRRVRELRQRDEGEDWEVKLEPLDRVEWIAWVSPVRGAL